jgi:hypothetical protein
MSSTLIRGLLAASILLAAPLARAQGTPTAVGTWRIEYARGQRLENGASTPIMGTGTLAITAKGDSLMATLEVGPRPDGTVPAPAQLRGVKTADGAKLVQRRQSQITMNGEQSTVEMTITWELHVAGDAISGTLSAVSANGELPPTDGPVKGTRTRG